MLLLTSSMPGLKMGIAPVSHSSCCHDVSLSQRDDCSITVLSYFSTHTYSQMCLRFTKLGCTAASASYTTFTCLSLGRVVTVQRKDIWITTEFAIKPWMLNVCHDVPQEAEKRFSKSWDHYQKNGSTVLINWPGLTSGLHLFSNQSK